MISKISLQACWLRSCFHQLTNLVLAEWCPHVPDVAARSLPIIYGLVKRAVSAIHFFWTVSLEFLVIENWTTFVVCCLRGWIRCSCITIAAAGPLSDFQIRNSLPVPLSVWRTMSPHFSFCFRLGHGIQSAVPVTTKLCVGGLQGFQRRISRCETTNLLRRWIVLLQREGDFLSLLQKPAVSFLERRTSLDLRNSRSLRMFSLEFLSFRYRCRLIWNDCSVAGSYDPPSFFFITIRNWHIKMLSSSAGISSIFLASPTSRKNLFQTCRSYSGFFTVFFLWSESKTKLIFAVKSEKFIR